MAQLKQYYDSKVSLYKTSSSREERILKLIPQGGKTVLDIGCGSGNLAKTLVDKGYTVDGVDISNEALLNAKDILRKSFCFDTEQDEWPEGLMLNKYDCIIISEVIEHLFSPEDLLKKAATLLADGGKVIVTTPNFLFWKNRARMLFGKFDYEKSGLLDFGHIRLFSYLSVVRLFKKCGLKVDREMHFYPNLYKRHLNWLGKIFPGLFSYQFIFLLSSE